MNIIQSIKKFFLWKKYDKMVDSYKANFHEFIDKLAEAAKEPAVRGEIISLINHNEKELTEGLKAIKTLFKSYNGLKEKKEENLKIWKRLSSSIQNHINKMDMEEKEEFSSLVKEFEKEVTNVA